MGQSPSLPSGQVGAASGQVEPKISHKSYAAIMPGVETQSQLPQDLRQVVEGWDALPEAVKAGIVAMVKAARGAK